MKKLSGAKRGDLRTMAAKGFLPLIVALGLLMTPASGEAWTVHVQNWCYTTKTVVVYSYSAEIGRTTIDAYSDTNQDHYKKDIPLPGLMCPTRLVVLNQNGQYEFERYTAKFPLIQGTPTCWDIHTQIVSTGGGSWICDLQLD